LTWDYGPERTSITFICATNGSCAFATGDLNVVMQHSTDHGLTWSRDVGCEPGLPGQRGRQRANGDPSQAVASTCCTRVTRSRARRRSP
jgi:hypothetical protein